MAVEKCRKCSEQVSSDANKCPHCGTIDPCLTNIHGAVSFIVIIAFLWFFSGECRESNDSEPSSIKAATYSPPHSTLDAWVITQQFVETRLFAPGTAKWPWVASDDVAEHIGNGKYIVISYVDSENAFGAQSRTHFNCIVQHVRDDEWRLESLSFY